METVLTEARRLPEERRLGLTWSDGYRAELPYDELRGWCPCAGCQGHGTLKIRFQPPPQPVEPRSIQAVGNYAISIGWSDGHGTGIYRFDYLRRLALLPAAGKPAEISLE